MVTKPEATIEGYKGIEVTKIPVEVTAEDIDREIDRVRERNSRIVTVEDRAAENGDMVTIDLTAMWTASSLTAARLTTTS